VNFEREGKTERERERERERETCWDPAKYLNEKDITERDK